MDSVRPPGNLMGADRALAPLIYHDVDEQATAAKVLAHAADTRRANR